MRRTRTLRNILAAGILLPCMAVMTVTAAPSTEDLEQQKSEAQSEADNLQALRIRPRIL